MLATIPSVARSIDQYREWVAGDFVDRIIELAGPLKGFRILHLCAMPSRAWLSGTLGTLTSLMRDLGLAAELAVIRTRPQQMAVNRALNRALSGYFVQWTPDMCDAWRGHKDNIANLSWQDCDFIIVHDAELVGMMEGARSLKKASRAKWIWHCHFDVSRAQPDVWDFLMLHTHRYDRRIITSFRESVEELHPAYAAVTQTIDPLSLRNRNLPQSFVSMVLRQYGLDPGRPVVLSVLRNGEDLGVTSRIVDGFLFARDRLPGLQLLVFVAGDANDQQALLHAMHLDRKAGGADVRLLSTVDGIGNMEINALQRAAVAVLEGSGDEELAVYMLEAMWKARPIIVGNANAIRLGIEDGLNGCTAGSAEEYGNKIVRLIELPQVATTIGQAARDRVQEKFLITKLLHAYLTMLGELASQKDVATSGVMTTS